MPNPIPMMTTTNAYAPPTPATRSSGSAPMNPVPGGMTPGVPDSPPMNPVPNAAGAPSAYAHPGAAPMVAHVPSAAGFGVPGFAPAPQPAAAPAPPPKPPAPAYLTRAASALGHVYDYRPPPETVARAFQAIRSDPTTMVPPLAEVRGYFLSPRAASRRDAAWAVAALAEAEFALAVGGLPPAPFSASYLAHRASGPSVGEAMVVLGALGVPSSAFDGDDPALEPSPEADFAAGFFRLRPQPVDFSNRTSVQVMLATKHPVAVGMVALPELERPEGGKVAPMSVPAPGTVGSILGGVAIVLAGYTTDGWLALGPFGPEWGDGGFALLPYGCESLWLEAWAGLR